MSKRNRSPEEQARREKIRELLKLGNIGSMADIQNLFKETIAEFMKNGFATLDLPTVLCHITNKAASDLSAAATKYLILFLLHF